jgi:hypothetical protein
MKSILSLLLLAACASPFPQNETDIPFCKLDSECGIYRSRCGKFVTFNVKYGDYVEREFKNAFQDKAEAQARLLMGDDRQLAKPMSDWPAGRSGA